MGICFILCFFRTGWPATPKPPRALLDQIDPNQATWSDLAMLPGIGPVKAGTIVAFRSPTRDGGDESARVFVTPADLQAVRGIGPKTVRRIAPYLRFE